MASPSDAQWAKLLDIIEADRELRTGQFTGPNGKQRLMRKWEEAAEEMNAIRGAFKSGPQWKDAFFNLKARAKKAFNDKISYLKGTGGGLPYEKAVEEAQANIGHIYKRTLNICGTVTATGNIRVPNPLQLRSERENGDFRSFYNRNPNERRLDISQRYSQTRFNGLSPPSGSPTIRHNMNSSHGHNDRVRGSPGDQRYPNSHNSSQVLPLSPNRNLSDSPIRGNGSDVVALSPRTPTSRRSLSYQDVGNPGLQRSLSAFTEASRAVARAAESMEGNAAALEAAIKANTVALEGLTNALITATTLP